MTDTIIKGTGNSRTLKTVPNALTLYPDWPTALQAMIDGTFPIDLGGLQTAGIDQKGTDLNKENLLTDDLCTALGLETTATPTEAMNKLRELIGSLQSGKASVVTGSYTGNGVIGQSNGTPPSSPRSLTFPFTPKCVIITTSFDYKNWALLVLINGVSYAGSIFLDAYADTYKTPVFRVNTTWSGNKVSWYAYGWRNDSNDAILSANSSGKTYYYIAIG